MPVHFMQRTQMSKGSMPDAELARGARVSAQGEASLFYVWGGAERGKNSLCSVIVLPVQRLPHRHIQVEHLILAVLDTTASPCAPLHSDEHLCTCERQTAQLSSSGEGD